MYELLTTLGFSSFYTISGMAVLLFAMWRAMQARDTLLHLLLWLCLMDAGYLLIGVGSGAAEAKAGALLQLLFTGTARLLAILTLTRLAAATASYAKTDLCGAGRSRPVSATLFAFAMFAALGISPFFTPDAKPLIMHGALSAGNWIPVLLLVAANAVAVILTVQAVHAVWLQPPSSTQANTAATESWLHTIGGLGLAALLILMGLNGHGLSNLIASTAALPSFAPDWHLSVLVPYVGAFVIWFLGAKNVKLRNCAACITLAVTVVCAFTESGFSPLARLFAIMASSIGLLVVLYSCGYIEEKQKKAFSTTGYYFFLLLLFGSLTGIATSTSLGGLYVFWELMTLSSYVLIAYEDTPHAHRAAVTYFIMCSVAAAVMLPGLLLLSTNLGTLDISLLATKAPTLSSGLASGIALLALIGFGVKAGLVPGHAWLPVAHPAAPSSISAPLSGVLTKTGIFGIIQLFFGIFGVSMFFTPEASTQGLPPIGILISALGLCTMLYGEFMALKQTDIKRLFAYSTMGQIGEITLTLGLFSWLATTGALLHVLNHAIMKDLLFLCSGALIMRAGTRELSGLKGLGKAMPFTATCMVIGLISILGLPPFAGFMSKYLMLYALAGTSPVLAGTMLLASLAGGVYYIRIIRTLIFEPYTGPRVPEVPWTMRIPLGILAFLCVLLGMYPGLGLSLVLPVVTTFAHSGKLAMQALPHMAVLWQPYTVLLLGAAFIPILLRPLEELSARICTGALILAAFMVPFFGTQLDTISTIFAFLVPAVGAINMYYASEYMKHSHSAWRFYSFFMFMIAGLTGVAASTDLFNFFFFWEIMSSWSLYFVIVHEENAAALREGFKYFFFNITGAAFLFLGVVLMGNWCGGVAFTTVASKLPTLPAQQTGLIIFLMATGFIMKAAQLPFRIDIQMHPATAPTPVSGYISSVLLKSALFGLLKLFAVFGTTAASLGAITLYGQQTIMTATVWIGGITIVMAAAFAVFQSDLKRILIYSTVSQLGYMLVAIALGTSLGIAGGLLHLLNHVLFKNLLFLVAGALMVQTGRHSVDSMGGLGVKMPVTMLLFCIGALCVIGVPPSNGFTSKWIIYHALMEQGHVLVAILSLVGSVITLAYFAKLMHIVFLGQPNPSLAHVQEAPRTMLIPMIILASGCVLTSAFPGLFLGPLNWVLADLSLAPLDVAPWGLASGKGAWNATATMVLFVVAWYGGRYVLHALTGKQRVSPIHTCGIEPAELNLHTTSRDIYSSPSMLLHRLKK